MTLTKEQIQELKKQLFDQIGNLPLEQKESAQKAQRRQPLLYGWRGFSNIFIKVYVGAYFCKKMV